MGSIISELKKTVVFLGFHVGDKIRFVGTGFIITIDGFFHLITAKHVVMDKSGNFLDKDMQFFFNTASSEMAARGLDDLKQEKVNWIFHQNPDVDIAIIPTQLDPKTEDIQVIPTKQFVSFDELIETQDVVYISYQPKTTEINKINPVVRNGIISQLKDNKTFLVDGFAFPGNSGSPVFIKSTSFVKTKNDVPPSELPKFAGIIGAYLTYEDEAISRQTGQTRVIFQENTGLSIVWSLDYLKEILSSEDFKKQLDFVKGKKPEPVKTEERSYRTME